MANLYTNVQAFKEWLPERFLAELTNDIGGFTADDEIIDKAMDWAVSLFESRVMVRDDIPIPALSDNGKAPTIVIEAIHDLTTYRLYQRRGHMPQSIEVQYENQMEWLNDIVNRRANIKIEIGSKDVTKTNNSPIIDGDRTNKFSKFTF